MIKYVSIGAAVVVVAGIGITGVMAGVFSPAGPCPELQGSGATIGGPFELVMPDGTVVTETDIITEPSLIYFGYTFCPDVCPIDNARNAAAVDILAEAGHSTTPIFITVDPKRDTPEVVGDYIQNFHPKMIGLTGSEAQISAASDAYRTFYQAENDGSDYYLVSHSVYSYFVTPDQGFVAFFKRDAAPQIVADTVSCFLNG